MKLYICFANDGLVLAKAGVLDESELLRHVQAIAYLGPLSVAQAIEYLERTHPVFPMTWHEKVGALAVSCESVHRLPFHNWPGYQRPRRA